MTKKKYRREVKPNMPRYQAFCASVLLIIAVLALAGCGKRHSSNGDSDSGQTQKQEADWFIEIASESGLDFVHQSGVQGDYFMPEIVGSGGAIFDYDNDGDLDIYLVNSGSLAGKQDSRNRLFRQSPDGRFSDVTEEAGVGDPGYGMGTAVGDIDNDGDLDILVTNYGGDRLYRNNGDGTFTDITTAAGIHGSQWSTSAAFCDYDLDSYLDLYVVTYVTNDPPRACTNNAGEIEYCGPSAYRGVSDQLYRNNGDGTFSDTSAESGISRVVNKGLGVVCFDFDRDNLPDIFVANDGENNTLWINRGDGTFEDRGIAFGVAVNIFGKPEASMGIALGDVDRDLSLDLFLTHLDQETNTLYLGTHGNALTDTTATSGLGVSSMPFTGFGTAFFDADQDGDLDLIIANGRVKKGPDLWSGSARADLPAQLESFLRAYAEPNILMENTGAGKYRDICGKAGLLCSTVEVSRGLLTVDIDLDGDLDVLLTNLNGPTRLFRNEVPDKGNWLMLRVIDSALNRDAIGALASIRYGDTWLIRPVIHTRSYLSSGDASVHFGLGESSQVDEIVITWPGGAEERFPGALANQMIIIRKGEGMARAGRDGS